MSRTTIVRSTFAAAIWLYALIKIFVADLDQLAVALILSPDAAWILNYRLALIFIATTTYWTLAGNRRFWTDSAFVLFYPAILIFWQAPYLIFRRPNWIAIMTTVDLLCLYLAAFRRELLNLALFVSGAAAVFWSNHTATNTAGIVALLASFALSLATRLTIAVNPPNIYQALSRVATLISNNQSLHQPEKDLASVSPRMLDEKQRIRRTERLGNALLLTGLMSFSSRQLRDYRRSGLLQIAHVLTVLGLFVWATLTFAIVAFAIQRVDPGQYQTRGACQALDWWYFSFNSMLYNADSDPCVSPAGWAAKGIAATQAASSLVVLSVLLAVFGMNGIEQQRQDLDSAIEILGSRSKETLGAVLADHGLTAVAPAIEELDDARSPLAGLLRKLFGNSQ